MTQGVFGVSFGNVDYLVEGEFDVPVYCLRSIAGDALTVAKEHCMPLSEKQALKLALRRIDQLELQLRAANERV